MKTTIVSLSFCVLLLIGMIFPASAAVVNYDLTIARETINVGGQNVPGMTINGSIPGPTLVFTEGDTALIRVQNRMPADTSIHWHGLLVPPGMDGVPNLSFPSIAPGETFTYEFPIRQHGTYWYHSHSGLQEQSGVYGSIVIHPQSVKEKPDRDHVVLFSDWTDESPEEVMRTLQRGSEWYALQKGSGQSVLGSVKAGRLKEYFQRELQRMPPMDIADVVYDRFLANGQPQTALAAQPGDVVRLRLIDGSATTYFHLEFAGGPMKVIAADGIDVVPFEEKRVLIGVAETYDVLATVPGPGAYELRATAHDGSGYASVWIGSGQQHPAPAVPKPDLYLGVGHFNPRQILALTPAASMGMSGKMVAMGHLDKPGMMPMDHAGAPHSPAWHDADRPGTPMPMGGSHSGIGHSETSLPRSQQPHAHELAAPEMQMMMPEKGHVMHKSSPGVSGKAYGTDFGFLSTDIASRPNRAVDGGPERPWPPYDKLRAIRPTAFGPQKPVRTIRLTLDGDMERYVWLLNNKALSESDFIPIREGEVVRFVMINRTMMHHPMHLHGHFFRVLNDQGDHAPLKHTVNVAPMSTTVIEFEANEVGDWFFHCHLLYHMKAGMARSLHYTNFETDPEVAVIQKNLFKENWTAFADIEILTNMTEGTVTLANTRNIFRANWEIGWQAVDETEVEGIFTWDYYVNRFLTVFAGVNSLGDGKFADEIRGVAGVGYLLPLNLESRFWLDTDGGLRVSLEKEIALAPRWELVGEVEYDTHENWEGKIGLHYILTKNASLIGQWHSEFGWGGGIEMRW